MNGSGNTGRAGVAAAGLLLAALAAGGAQGVPGTAHAEGEGPSLSAGPTTPPTTAQAGPPTSFQEPSGPPTVTVQPDETADPSAPSGPTVPGPLPGPTTTTPRTGGRTATPQEPPAATAGTSALTADVVRDECLLDAAGFGALLGGPVGRPAENAVTRPDGTTTRSCYATGTTGSPAPTGAINVYRVNRGTPAGFVRAAAAGRPLAGIGEAAVLLDTVGGTTLQVATQRYLVTISVADTNPTDDRWRAAGQSAVAAADRV